MRIHYLTILSVFIHSISSSVLAFYSQSYYTSNACLVGFQAQQRATYTTRSSAQRIWALQETSNPNDKIEGKEKQSGGIPALPPIGESASKESFRSMNLNGSNSLNSEKTSEPIKVPVAFVGSKKFEMQYTCNVCDKRNSIRVSRLAYTKGVVIGVCKGCGTKHLIADNLGWSNYIGGFETGETNIEEFLEANGRSDDVTRVNPTIWELENTLAINSDKKDTNWSADDDKSFE